ncbi:MAG: hypothetical protein U0793_22545 [Gemmataceae bacterium]
MVLIVFWSVIAVGILAAIALAAVGSGGIVLVGVVARSARLRRFGATLWHYAAALGTVAIHAHVGLATILGLISILAAIFLGKS